MNPFLPRPGNFIASDGALLCFLERPARTPAAGTAVLLPSLFFGASMFEEVAAQLPPQWRVVCPDHRGQGASESGLRAPTMGQLAADTEALIQALGDGPVHLVGSSMGGYVAMELAVRRPDLLRSCVLSCCTAEAEQQPERFAALEAALRAQGPAALVDGLVQTMFGSHFIEAASPALAHWRQHFAALDARIPDAVHEVFARNSHVDSLSRLTMPVLLFSGALDRAKKPADMQFIADRVPGSRHIVLEASGHTPPIEQPGRFAEALAAFWAA
ncbi:MULTISPECIES: alpha/beta fold hydrolase [unclassified Variovorax]|uniref:alpha/beta fold hydrolase n=1 Tax=unclassified Variovorax TaxID=663243 RepID=UPI002578EB49|nr:MULTISPECIES: alpha/beta fold hydrolase [unclassified Variovorax]MDM0087868.1 alpha/beta fold hydrolase [Variovorax sp. J22G40]MDM0143876.1 alpha/beta fold hydrolase [Variovorax sp. J2P1-31]